MPTFDDFWESISDEKFDYIKDRAIELYESNDSPEKTIYTAALIVFTKMILAEYHEWLLSNFLQNH